MAYKFNPFTGTFDEIKKEHALNDLSDVTYSSGDLTITDLDTITYVNSSDAILKVATTSSGTDGRDLTIEAGSAPTGSANQSGGDLILKAGGGDGTGTSMITFSTKVTGTDAVAERLRIDTNGQIKLNDSLNMNAKPMILNVDGDRNVLSFSSNKAYAGGSGRFDIAWNFLCRDGTNHGIQFVAGGDNDGDPVGNACMSLNPTGNSDYWGGVLRITGQSLSYVEQGTGTIEFTRGTGTDHGETQPDERSAWIKSFTSKYNLEYEGDSSGSNFPNYTALSSTNYASSLAFATTSVNDIQPTEKFRIQPDGSFSLYSLRSGSLNLTTNSDGAKDHYLKCGAITELSGVQNFTISTWIKKTGTDTEYIFWSQELDDNNYLELALRTSNDVRFTWVGTSHQGASAESGSTTTVTLDWQTVGNNIPPIATNKWTHLVIVYDGSQATAGNRIKFYWNGGLESTDASSGTIPVKTPNLTGGSSPASDFNIGGDAKTDSRYFIGYIGETAIWNNSLTATQVVSLYDNGYPRDATTIAKDNLIAYWKMDELDSSGNVINFVNSGTYDGDPTGDSDAPALSSSDGKQASIFETSPTGINVYRNRLNINNNYISESEGILLVNKNNGIYINSDGNTSFLGESKCVEFNDVIGDAEGSTRYIDCGNIPSLNSLATFTVSIWVYHTMKAAQTVWGLSEDSGSDLKKMSLEIASDNVISVHLDAANSVLRGVDDGSNHAQNEWINYTVVYNGGESTDANELKLFKNGNQITFSSIGSIGDTTPNFGSEKFYIGKHTTGTNDEWQGRIGETAIWTTNLSSAEVMTLYDCGHPYQANAIQPDSLITYWKMDASGSNASTSNTDNITVSNSAKNYLGLYDATVEGTGAYKFIAGLPYSVSKATTSGVDILRGDFNFYGGNHNLQDVQLAQTYSMAATTNTTTNLSSYTLTQKGITASGQTANNTGITLTIDSSTPTMVGTVNNIGMNIDVRGGTSGTQENTGLVIRSYDADTNNHIKCKYDDSNYMTLSTIANGATTLATVDSDGAVGHFTLDADGDIILDAAGADVKFAFGGTTVMGFDIGLSPEIRVNASASNAADYFTLTPDSNGSLTVATTDAAGANADLNLDIDGDITLDSHTGVFIAKQAGTEFSVANSAYAGMILGYTTVGIDAADDSYTLSATMTCLDDALKVKFVAPPSGAVEIFAQIYFDASRRAVAVGLSDQNETTGYAAIDFPNSADPTNEHVMAFPPSSVGDSVLQPHWVVTGLTAGTAYEWWFAAKTTIGTGGVLRWGGNATNKYPPFIMKATALPAATTDYAVYG